MDLSGQDTTVLQTSEIEFDRETIDGLPLVKIVDFEDITTYNVRMEVRNTCGLYNNAFNIKVTSEDGCFVKGFTTTPDGWLTTELPPLSYKMTVTGAEDASTQLLTAVDYLRVRPLKYDLFNKVHHPIEQGEAMLEDPEIQETLTASFTFHKVPVIELSGFEYVCGDPEQPALVRQDKEDDPQKYLINISVAELHQEQCPVEEGFLIIKNPAAKPLDELGEPNPRRIDYQPGLGGFPLYQFTGGDPLTIDPYIYGMVVEYHTESGGFQGQIIQPIVVVGEKITSGERYHCQYTGKYDPDAPVHFAGSSGRPEL